MATTTTGRPTAEEIQTATEAIKVVKARYCRFADTKRWDDWGEVFAPDASFDVSEFPFARDVLTGDPVPIEGFSLELLKSLTAGASWPIVGRGAIVEYVTKDSAGLTSVHHVFSPEIEVSSRTTASAIWPVEDRLWFRPPADAKDELPFSFMQGWGHYHETYERIDGRWYIKTHYLTRLRVDWR